MGSKHSNSSRRRRALGATIISVTLVLAACGGDDDDAADMASEATAAEETFDAAGDSGGAIADTAESAPDEGAAVATGDGGIDLGSIGRDVIVEMYVTMSSDDIGRTVDLITGDAAALGGGIASSEIDFGTDEATGEQRGRAVLVLKVPPAQVDDLLGRLDDAGTVRSINQSAQDVTDQLVDLDVRIENARRSVDSVREFMERTENLRQLVDLESELTRRQTDLERLEAQRRNLRDRVAMSTITIEVVPTAAIPAPPPVDEPSTIGDAFRTGWDVFVGVAFGIAFAAALLLPFLVIASIVLAGWWLVRRGRRTAAGSDGDRELDGGNDPHDGSSGAERDVSDEPEPATPTG